MRGAKVILFILLMAHLPCGLAADHAGAIDIWAWPRENVPQAPEKIECQVSLVARDGLATLVCWEGNSDIFLAHSEAAVREGQELVCQPKDGDGESTWFTCQKKPADDRPTREDDREDENASVSFFIRSPALPLL